jgi:hypothetical protein
MEGLGPGSVLCRLLAGEAAVDLLEGDGRELGATAPFEEAEWLLFFVVGGCVNESDWGE